MAGTAQVFVLHEGYVREEDDADRVGSTVTLIVDGGRVIVVDPGMVADRDELIAALAAHGLAPGDVTDIVFSHHHPDHTVNAALFPGARIHDFWASYDGDLWIGRDPGEFDLTPSVRLVPAAGHTPEDIATLAATPEGVYTRAPTPGGGRTARRRTRWPPPPRNCGPAGSESSPSRP